MQENPLLKLSDCGQSVWLDNLSRHLLNSGELRRLIDEDGLRGVTSNPAIFEKAINGSRDYDDDIGKLSRQGKGIQEIYETLTVSDVQRAADLFLPMFRGLEGADGFVSLEVNPHLAHDTPGTIAEARRLWDKLDRHNVFIKVPATLEGLPAIRQLISEGINVNVTLLFGLPRYREVAEAYLSGLEERVARGLHLGVVSVASFFLSRIDTLVDQTLKQMGGTAASLEGEVAMASAKVADAIHHQIFGSRRFKVLQGKGARPQRLLWASTSTKNPAYNDVKYVEPLIGPDTINTMPVETINAYRDHGKPACRLSEGLDQAAAVLQRLPELGIDLNRVTQQLEDEGVEKFIQPFDNLMGSLEAKSRQAPEEVKDRRSLSLGKYQATLEQRLRLLEEQGFCGRLWRKDPSLWRTDPRAQRSIVNSLGWLDVVEKMEASLTELAAFTQEVREAGFRQVVHMGMGGSSLAPLVLGRTFPLGARGLPVTVLDTTDPATIQRIEYEGLPQKLFLVASKSGTTAEPLAFMEYFYHRLQDLKGERAGENFVAITDPGSLLAQQAQERGFRRTFLNFADIGGRYSALSYFGLLPAALMDLDLPRLLDRALGMIHACASCASLKENPGVVLGAALGELALAGRDKLTLIMPPALDSLGMWLEQLLAESTGKEGKGLLPVAGEALGPPELYGSDRVFAYFHLREEVEMELERGVAALKAAGQPVITIRMADRYDLAQEFFRWEVATATVGAVLGINPFDQPNVQESKDNTQRLLTMVQEQGTLPQEGEGLAVGPLSFYLQEGAQDAATAPLHFFRQARPGDYLALLAYLTETPEVERALEDLRLALRERLRLPTTLGYGPRYLHSTGQLHKGGPNTGLFLELTADELEDLPVPGQPYTFGIFKRAQALGDLESLRQHGRRVMRIHLHGEVSSALEQLRLTLTSALSGGEK